MGGDERRAAAAAERMPARERLVRNHAQRVQVGAMVDGGVA